MMEEASKITVYARIEKVLQLNLPDITKAKHLIILCKEHPELYEPITNLLIDSQQDGVLTIFLTDLDNKIYDTKRKLPATSGSGWTVEQLDYFKIDFEDKTDTESICPTYPLSEQARRFLNENKDIDGAFEPKEKDRISEMINTAFKGYLLYVQKSPSVESCVDDMMRELLQQILGSNFLVKTKYEMPLQMCDGSTKATADVLAIFIPTLYMGVIIVEDKPHEKSKTKDQHYDTEAQMIAEGIAIAQQKRWPVNSPIFMLRVLETNVTFYKACFTNELILSVKRGLRRSTPFIITRLEYINDLFPNDRPGYNLLRKDEREKIVHIINNIGTYITTLFTER